MAIDFDQTGGNADLHFGGGGTDPDNVGSIQPLDILNFGQPGEVPMPGTFDFPSEETDGTGQQVYTAEQYQQMQNRRPAPVPTNQGYSTDGKSVDQIMAEMQGIQPNQPQAIDPNAPKPGEADYDPLNDPQRMEYHQSRADKIRLAMERMQREYGPIVQAVRNNPQLEAQIFGNTNGEPVEPQPQFEKLVIPIRPVKPAGYNDADLSDPSSESAKYKAAIETYRDDVSDYMLKRDEQAAQKEQIRQQAVAMQQAEQAKVNETVTKLKTVYKMNDVKANRFMKYMTDPSKFQLPNLIGFFNYLESQEARGGRPMPGSRTNGNPAPAPPNAGGLSFMPGSLMDNQQGSGMKANDFMTASLMATAKNRHRVS